MNNIVLYGMVLMVGLLTICTEIDGQKPAYDLLPSSHNSIHPEAIVDTSIIYNDEDSIVSDNYPLISSSGTILNKETRRNEKKRPGIHLDSLFKRPVSENEHPGKKSGNYPLNLKYFNPINFFLQITALKK